MSGPQHDNDDAFGCLLPFDTDDAEFVRGFEAGRVWQRLQLEHDAFAETVHATNSEMVLRMAEAHGRTVVGHMLDADWTWVEFGEASSMQLD